MRSLILEGFMGCGKSYAARNLSAELKLPFIDTDAEIEKKAGKKISRIFADEGEEAFRRMETEELELLLKRGEKAVISLGGGLPCREENRRLLKELGTVIYLKASPGLLMKRLKNGVEKRPMLAGQGDLRERIETLLAEREEQYLAAADITIELDTVNDRQIVSVIRKELGL